MKIALVTRGLPFSGDTLEKRSLGGSETALICMARSLARLGCSVDVFCDCDNPGQFDGVRYHHVDTFTTISTLMTWDVLVVSRAADYLRLPTNVGLRVLWCHDVLTNGAAVANCLFQTDLVMLLSAYHIKNYTEGREDSLEPFKDYIWKTSNGIDLELVDANRQPKEPKKLIYTSRPERGLLFLLRDIFPKVLEKHPDAKLYYANYSLDKFPVGDEVRQIAEVCQALAKRLGDSVVPLGHLTKAELYKHISSSAAMVYPTPFPEISCCAAGTYIQMPCDRSKYPFGVPIEELVGKENFPVYAYDADEDRFVLGTCSKVWETGQDRECLDIELDDGTVLTVTPEHLIMDFDGNWHRADELIPGMRLNALHMRYNTAIKDRDGRWADEHRMVGEWKAGRPLNGHQEHVNHLDPTRLNNSPEMLEVIGRAEHHSKTFTGIKHSKQAKARQVAAFKEWCATPEGVDSLSARGSARAASLWEKLRAEGREKEFSKARAEAKRNKHPEYTAAVARLIELAESGFTGDQVADTLNEEGAKTFFGSAWTTASVRTIKSRYYENLPENHQVVSIRPSTERHTVYDMTVEKYHNFVANGVVVHNCISMMEAAACGTPAVTTRDFALTETVKDGRTGVLVAGTPQDPQYIQRFVSVVDYLLKDDKKRNNMSKEGPKWVRERGYIWDKVAQTWLKKFQDLFDRRWAEHGDKILLEMERNSDILPALQFAKAFNLDATRLETAAESLSLEQPTSYEDVQRIVRRWEKVVKVAHDRNLDVSTVLDFHCGEAAFGLHLLKVNSKAHVTFVDPEERVRGAIQTALEKAELADRATVLAPTALPEGEQFALVFCGDKIDMHPDPQKFIAELGNLAKDGGSLVFTSRTGAKHATVGHDPRQQFRLWNFFANDYVDMFQADGPGSGLNLVEEGVGVGGDPLGHWIVAVAKEHTKNLKPLDLSHRTRLYRPYVRLGVGMIARDAAEWIVKCLKHIRPIVDDIHIALDDRTKDSTMSLALEHGADKVWPVKFSDFSQVRNDSVKDLQNHDWILWIDTDEMLIDGAKLRRYLRSPLFRGYGLRQQHLMIDVHGTYDMPIRLYRPCKDYAFYGIVHEHCSDLGKDPHGNESIAPSILIPDVDLAHYGYPNEQSRRAKCSNRNMELLIRDVKENGTKGRLLSWVLVMRDYLNIAKWRINPLQPHVRKQSIEHYLLEAAIRVYLKFFINPVHKYHGLTFGMYQEALSLLGSSGIPFEDRPTPPFEVAVTLGGSVGGMQNKDIKPQAMWFIDMQQFIDHMNRATLLTGSQMGVCNPAVVRTVIAQDPKVAFKWNDHDLDLLLLGLNNIDATTGRLMRA